MFLRGTPDFFCGRVHAQFPNSPFFGQFIHLALKGLLLAAYWTCF
jgi:hypothetical protein